MYQIKGLGDFFDFINPEIRKKLKERVYRVVAELKEEIVLESYGDYENIIKTGEPPYKYVCSGVCPKCKKEFKLVIGKLENLPGALLISASCPNESCRANLEIKAKLNLTEE